MRDVKWTTGEWDVDFLIGSKRYAVRNKNKYHIATMVKNIGMSDGEDEANARLIAAAPDLYEALDNLLSVVYGEGGTIPDAHEIARTALAKARGES